MERKHEGERVRVLRSWVPNREGGGERDSSLGKSANDRPSGRRRDVDAGGDYEVTLMLYFYDTGETFETTQTVSVYEDPLLAFPGLLEAEVATSFGLGFIADTVLGRGQTGKYGRRRRQRPSQLDRTFRSDSSRRCSPDGVETRGGARSRDSRALRSLVAACLLLRLCTVEIDHATRRSEKMKRRIPSLWSHIAVGISAPLMAASAGAVPVFVDFTDMGTFETPQPDS